jgi:pyrimidine-nucleoside phosphorylase
MSNMLEIIIKKRDKELLTQEDIAFWIKELVAQRIPDYQSSALLMAIVLNGLSEQETAWLTHEMMHSGEVVDLSSIQGLTNDKHSTGGVGDKTSLVLAPLVAACGGKVAKMSGRGLGHTGGTIDKLESFPGFSTEISSMEFARLVNENGLAIMGQSKNLVPADKLLYALRDVSGTVPAIPLIASSIMSKKLAAGSDAILLDVKFGDGAFMKDVDQARELANAMISIGKHANKNTKAILSDMNQPLGFAIGNALEVKEAIETLKGEGPEDLTQLCVEAASLMLVQSHHFKDHESAKQAVYEAISSGRALEKFKVFIQAQGGDAHLVDDVSLLPQSKFMTPFLASSSGIIQSIKAMPLGLAASLLGAGRLTKEDQIKFGVGFVLKAKVGDKVSQNDVICEIYHDEPISDDVFQKLNDAIIISNHEVEPVVLIHEICE